jgi:hypothetical protein
MSFLEIFTLFASAATIFGVIVGVFSVYNGRMTRREVAALIQETQRETQMLIAREAEATRQILQGVIEILGRIEERVR